MGVARRRHRPRRARALRISVLRLSRRRRALTRSTTISAPCSLHLEPPMTQTATSLDDIHPRRPLVAALLSLSLPGLGQLYNGEINKALWLFLAFVLMSVPGVTTAPLYVPAVLMLALLLTSVLLALGVWLGAIIDAWRQAARPQIYTRAGWQVNA